MKKLKWVVMSLVMSILACTKSVLDPVDTPAACDSVAKSFSANVSPLIQSSCTSSECHGSGSINGPGALLNYTNIFAARVAIRSAISAGSMPKNSSFSSAQKNTIICWIDSGAPNN